MINATNITAFFSKALNDGQLTDKVAEQIAYQLEKRCRNVEPLAYRKQEK